MTTDVLPVGLILEPSSPRGRKTLDAIIAAAVEVFGEGTHGRQASISAVAKKINLSPAAIYQYFPDRESVLLAAVEADVAALYDATLQAVAGVENAISSNAFGEAMTHVMGDFPLARAAIVEEHIDVAELPRVKLRIDRCVALLEEEIARAREAGIARMDIDAHEVATAIMYTSLYTTIPDRLAGRPQAPRSVWLRYLSAASFVKFDADVDIEGFAQGRAPITVGSRS